MVRPVDWDWDAVADFVMAHGTSFARIKTPRGWPAMLRRHHGTLLGKCWRNSQVASFYSNNSMYYCEGFARAPDGYWQPHAWCAYKENNDAVPMWAVDLTWQWTYKGRKQDKIEYSGVAFEPLFVHEFQSYLQHNFGCAKASVFSNFEHLPHFINQVY